MQKFEKLPNLQHTIFKTVHKFDHTYHFVLLQMILRASVSSIKDNNYEETHLAMSEQARPSRPQCGLDFPNQ